MLFAAGNPFETPLLGSETVDATLTGGFVKEVNRQLVTKNPVPGPAYRNLIVAPAGTPLRKLHLRVPQPWNAALDAVLQQGVPLPANAQPSPSSDKEFLLYDPASKFYMDAWKFDPAANTIDWGGVFKNLAQCPGHFTDTCCPGRPTGGYPSHLWGAAATSIPYLCGLTLMSELQAGVIPHALGLSITNPADQATRGWTFPAQRSDGWDKALDTVPEGARLRLDPAFDLNSIKSPYPLVRILAKAAQVYGLIVCDRVAAPSNVNVHANVIDFQLAQTAAEKATWKMMLGGTWAGNVISQFPWTKLQVLTVPKWNLNKNKTTTP